jgi:hypothetical protein
MYLPNLDQLFNAWKWTEIYDEKNIDGETWLR